MGFKCAPDFEGVLPIGFGATFCKATLPLAAPAMTFCSASMAFAVAIARARARKPAASLPSGSRLMAFFRSSRALRYALIASVRSPFL